MSTSVIDSIVDDPKPSDIYSFIGDQLQIKPDQSYGCCQCRLCHELCDIQHASTVGSNNADQGYYAGMFDVDILSLTPINLVAP